MSQYNETWIANGITHGRGDRAAIAEELDVRPLIAAIIKGTVSVKEASSPAHIVRPIDLNALNADKTMAWSA